MEDDGFTLNYSKNKRKKRLLPSAKKVSQSRAPVSLKEVEAAMKWANHNCLNAASVIYSEINSVLQGKTIIQLQLYGIGAFDDKQSQGAFQLAVALNLFHRYKTTFSKTNVVFQDPIIVPFEVEFLQSQDVKVLRGESFSSQHFIEASTSAGIPNPAMICFMIHGHWDMFDGFLQAHWDPHLLSQIIFIGNELRSIETHPHYKEMSPKVKEFSKLCDAKPLIFEKDSRASKPFHMTDIFVISYNNAEILVNKFI